MVLIRVGLLAAALLANVDASGQDAFARYPAAIAPSARHAAPRIADPLSHRFRAALREAARGAPDFAGHYVLAQVGCGAGCIRFAAVDRSTGSVAWFPATVSGWPMAVTEPLTYRRASRLLVIQGMLDEEAPAATRRFLFDGRRFRPLTVQP